jgi:hypothetical protein
MLVPIPYWRRLKEPEMFEKYKVRRVFSYSHLLTHRSSKQEMFLSEWQNDLYICAKDGFRGRHLTSMESIRRFVLETQDPGSLMFRMGMMHYCELMYDYYNRRDKLNPKFKMATRVGSCYHLIMRRHPSIEYTTRLTTKASWFVQEVTRLNTKMRWTLVKAAVKILGLHSRAVITANHPNRKRDRGEFEEEEDPHFP